MKNKSEQVFAAFRQDLNTVVIWKTGKIWHLDPSFDGSKERASTILKEDDKAVVLFLNVADFNPLANALNAFRFHYEIGRNKLSAFFADPREQEGGLNER